MIFESPFQRLPCCNQTEGIDLILSAATLAQASKLSINSIRVSALILSFRVFIAAVFVRIDAETLAISASVQPGMILHHELHS